jgi:hypothetical protein
MNHTIIVSTNFGGAPGTPTVTAIAGASGSMQATVNWTAPTNTGGSPIASYVIRSDPQVGTPVPVGREVRTTTIGGLSNGTYTFSVTAINESGSSSNPGISNPITIGAPEAPTITYIANGTEPNELLIYYTAGGIGGSAITTYKYSTDDTNYIDLNSLSNPLKISGAIPGTIYNITIKARNIFGDSPKSNNLSYRATSTMQPINVDICGNLMRINFFSTNPSFFRNVEAIYSFTSEVFNVDSTPILSVNSGDRGPFSYNNGILTTDYFYTLPLTYNSSWHYASLIIRVRLPSDLSSIITLTGYVSFTANHFVAVGYDYQFQTTISLNVSGYYWTYVENPFRSGRGYGIAWNGSYWCAVGNNNNGQTITISTNGLNWIPANNNPFTNGNAYGIAWNKSFWISVGNSSSITAAKSTNGLDWTPSGNPFPGGSGYGIARSPTHWVAVGNSPSVTIARSEDGLTWTPATNSPFNGGQANGIAWTGFNWVAAGYNPSGTVTLATSVDGLNWTPGNNPFGPGGKAYGVAANGSLIVAVGNNTNFLTTVATSVDGLTWTPCTNTPDGREAYRSVAWNGYIWVAVGAFFVSAIFSRNGRDWTFKNTNGNMYIVNPFLGGVGYGIASQYPLQEYLQTIIVGSDNSDGKVYSTVDLENLVKTNASFVAYGFEAYGLGIAWNGSYWVAVGTGGSAKSTDGLNWSPTTTIFGGREGVNGIAWNGSYWVAVGRSLDNPNTIAKSPDAITWEISSNNPFNSLGSYVKRVAWNGRYWVAVGHDSGYSVTIARSPDGLNWTAANNPFPSGARANDVAYGNGLWVAVGNLLTIATSYDGLIWTAANNTFGSGEARGVAWNGSLWVVVGSGTGNSLAIATSTDGLNWTRATNIVTSDGGIMSAVAWNGSYWIAVSESSPYKVLLSRDGLTWTLKNNPENMPLAVGFVLGVSSKFIKYLLPPQLPGEPTINSIIPGNAQLSVNYTPGSDNGLTISTYTYSIGGPYINLSSTANPLIIGLANGTTYTIRIRSRNINGDSPPSNAVTELVPPPPVRPPGQCRIEYIVPGNGVLDLLFSGPSDNGGSPITEYSYSVSGGSYDGTIYQVINQFAFTISYLVNGQPYTVSIRAYNGTFYSEPITATRAPRMM